MRMVVTDEHGTKYVADQHCLVPLLSSSQIPNEGKGTAPQPVASVPAQAPAPTDAAPPSSATPSSPESTVTNPAPAPEPVAAPTAPEAAPPSPTLHPTSATKASPPPLDTTIHNASIGQIITEMARRNGVNPNLALALANARSGMNPKAPGGLYNLPPELFDFVDARVQNPIENANVALNEIGKDSSSQSDGTPGSSIPPEIAAVVAQLDGGANVHTLLPAYDNRTGLSIMVPGSPT